MSTEALEQRLATLERQLEATAEKALSPAERARRQQLEEHTRLHAELQAEADRETEKALVAQQRYQYEQVVTWAGGDARKVAEWYRARHLSPPPGVDLGA